MRNVSTQGENKPPQRTAIILCKIGSVMGCLLSGTKGNTLEIPFKSNFIAGFAKKLGKEGLKHLTSTNKLNPCGQATYVQRLEMTHINTISNESTYSVNKDRFQILIEA